MSRTEHRQLDGRVVAITGGARGIGEATAQALRTARARVVIGDVDEAAGRATAHRLGLEAFFPLDVTDPASFADFLRQSESTVGPLDVLINNAGIMPVGPLLDEDDPTARRVIDINVHGVVTGTKLAIRAMSERGSGHIINIASMAGVASVPGLATYNASKFAVVGFTDAVRLEVQALGIDVSMILPYFVNTELAAGTNGPRGFKKAEPVQVAEAIVATLERPVPRVYVPRATGNMVRFFQKLPQAWTERLNSAMGGDQIFLGGVDHHARAAYERRARGLDASHAPSDRG
jgi:NAD(P)-dependent dehydrogenase (short-subunit alcohol dehydrogenase family)